MVQVVDSTQKQLSSKEIMKIAAENTKVGRPIDDVYNMLRLEFAMPSVWKMQQGNTIFIVHRSKVPGYGFFRALNADSPRMFLRNSEVFAKAAYKVGFDVLVTQFNDPTVLNVFKYISRNPPQEQMGYQVQKTDDGGFQVILQLGPQRGEK